MALEVVTEELPIERYAMVLEISQRKRKAVVNADQRRRPFGEFFNQPPSNALASPILAWTGWRLDLLRGGRAVGCVNAQALKARRGRLSARIIDADVPFECGGHEIVPRGRRALLPGEMSLHRWAALLAVLRGGIIRIMKHRQEKNEGLDHPASSDPPNPASKC